MADDITYDLVIIGAGPGGEVGAIRAAQLGLKVALVEKYPHLGGTCLNFGCIPTKALIESAKVWTQLKSLAHWGLAAENPSFQWEKILERKNDVVTQQRNGLNYLMKKNKVAVFAGTGRLLEKNLVEVSSESGKTQLRCKNILLATGSKVRELPGATADGKKIFTSDSILSIDHVPKRLLIIGGGVVGMEFASLFGRFGSEVTVLEMLPQILPTEDNEVVGELVKLLKKQQVTVHNGAAFTELKPGKDSLMVSYKNSASEMQEIEVDTVLTSIGREPNIKDIGLERLGIIRDGAFIRVDTHYREFLLLAI
jgi:dihydrolipoamide dehydrogenase